MGNSNSAAVTKPPPSSDQSTEAKPVASASTTPERSSVSSQQSGNGNSKSVEGTEPPPSSDQSIEAKAKPVASASTTTNMYGWMLAGAATAVVLGEIWHSVRGDHEQVEVHHATTASQASEREKRSSSGSTSSTVNTTSTPGDPSGYNNNSRDQSRTYYYDCYPNKSASNTGKRFSVASQHSGDGNSKSAKGTKPPPLPDHSTKGVAKAKAKDKAEAEAKSFLRKGRAPNKIPVFWLPPTRPFVKVNTDGVSKNNPGAAACGGVFRDFQGEFLGAFTMNLGCRSSLVAEIMGIIQGISYAAKRGWNFIWLESDSTLAIDCLSNPNFNPPPCIANDWLNCKASISKMSFQCTHIYREGNKVADIMANLGLCSSGSIWFDTAPLQIKDALYKDCSGVPNYRFIT
ncbi:Ribonuclease H protein [Melia azedarach]|uniref:Ribonuclease H protein n=1 Tax=Melia azedarach TaxID=155640 RepID=A0ACC1XG63_MELAZ|nr:Ribonuclease H protein [Melia azedarach]